MRQSSFRFFSAELLFALSYSYRNTPGYQEGRRGRLIGILRAGKWRFPTKCSIQKCLSLGVHSIFHEFFPLAAPLESMMRRDHRNRGRYLPDTRGFVDLSLCFPCGLA